jgi:hypothetical protein
VVIFTRVYTNTDGVFGSVKDIEGEEPLWVYVYEDRDRLIVQQSLYSVKVLNFTGRANSSYLVRYVTHGSSRMVSMHVSHLLTEAHIGSKLTVEDVADHQQRVRAVKNLLLFRLDQQKEKLVMQMENQRLLLVGFDHYYFYNIVEIVLLAVICVVQVESIRKLLLPASVV